MTVTSPPASASTSTSASASTSTSASASTSASSPRQPLAPLFTPAARTYNYAPCLIQETAAVRYAFYCANRTPGEVTDSICVRRAVLQHGEWKWGDESEALSPSPRPTWDSRHICDPDVIAGRFRFAGQNWSFALFYLGCDAEASTHNQVGVAFSHSLDGPWIRYPLPLIHYSAASDAGVVRHENGWPVYRFWGVGQPSAVSLDRAGKALLLYSRGEQRSGEEMVTIDFSDMDAGPTLGPPQRVPTDGLERADGRAAGYLTNVGLAYDRIQRRYYLVHEGDLPPADGRFPGFISSFVQTAWIPPQDLLAGRGRWREVRNTGAETTGWPRSHNACLLRDPFGRIPRHAPLTVGVSVAQAYDHAPASLEWLWSYRIVLAPLDRPPP